MFGQSAPSFGQNQPQASSSFTFGQTAGSSTATPAFGTPAQSSASIFGSAAPSPSPGALFSSASSSSLFGAPGSGAGLFGAASAAPAGGLFGAASSGAGLFGAASAPAASGGLFGGAASSSTLFGGASSSSLFGGASSGGLFGAASSGGLFGGGASSGGLFGGASTGGGLFGATPQGGGLFGAQSAAGAGTLAVHPGTAQGATAATAADVGEHAKMQQLAQEQQVLLADLQKLDAAVTPGDAAYKFTKLLLYVVEPGQRVRPPHITEAQWQFALRQAGGAANSEGLWPVAVQGFQQLAAHKAAQDEAATSNRGCLAQLQGVAQQLCATQEQELRQRAHRILRTHVALAHRLLQVVRLVDALEVRYSDAVHNRASNAELHRIAELLARIEAELAPNHVKGLKHRVHAVTAAAELQSSMVGHNMATPDWMDEESLAGASALVKEHNRGIEELQSHLRKMVRNITIIAHGEGHQRADMPMH